MPDRLLKQEEIDALLQAQASLVPPSEEQKGEELPLQEVPAPAQGAGAGEDTLSEEEKDALGEVGNICMGQAATTLSMLLNQKVSITSPRVEITTVDELFNTFSIPHMAIFVRFIKGLSGFNLLIAKLKDAAVMADLMMGGDGSSAGEDLDEIGISAASEAMNQMIGSAATAMATMFGEMVNISPPETKIYRNASDRVPEEFGVEGRVVVVWFKMTVGDILDTQIMQVMDVQTAKEEAALLLRQLADAAGDEKGAPAAAAGAEPAIAEAESVPPFEPPPKVSAPPPAAGVSWQDTPAVQPPAARPLDGAQPGAPHYAQQQAAFGIDQGRLDLILDIPLKVSVILGRTQWPIKDILELGPGSVVELQNLVDEPVEVLVNGTLVAVGEVVVVNENFGVRITRILSPEERLKRLKK